MDKDYQNFVGRMGSFEDEINLDDLEDVPDLEHTSKLLVEDLLHSIGDKKVL